MITPRPYQTKAIDYCARMLAERGNSLLVAATGAGKTVMLGKIAEYLVKNLKCGRVYVIVGRDKINRQNKETIRKCAVGIPVSEYSGRIKSLHGRIVCMTQQTAARHFGNLPRPDAVLIDETHHARAETYEQELIYWRPRYIFGATATPDRGDKKSLVALFDNFYQISTRQLIEMNYLCKPEFYPFECNTDNESDINISLTHLPLLPGKTIHFCRDHAHAGMLVDVIQRIAGKCAYLADNRDNDPEYDMFAHDDKCQHLVNVDIATEGFDEPRIMNVIDWCSDGTRGRFVQKIGRGLRPMAGKRSCRVFDCGGNIAEYGDLDYREILPEECAKKPGDKLRIEDLFADPRERGGDNGTNTESMFAFDEDAKTMPYAPPRGWFSFYDNDVGVVFVRDDGVEAEYMADGQRQRVTIKGDCDISLDDFDLGLGAVRDNDQPNQWQLRQLAGMPTFGFTPSQADAALGWVDWKQRNITKEYKNG